MDKLKNGITQNFFMVQNAVLDLKLLPADFAIYCVLLRYANNQTGEAFPGYRTIAEKANITRRRAIEGIKTLEERGLLKKEKRVKKGLHTSNIYTVYGPEQAFVVNSDHQVVNSDHHSSELRSPGVVNSDHPELNLFEKDLLKKGFQSEVEQDEKPKPITPTEFRELKKMMAAIGRTL